MAPVRLHAGLHHVKQHAQAPSLMPALSASSAHCSKEDEQTVIGIHAHPAHARAACWRIAELGMCMPCSMSMMVHEASPAAEMAARWGSRACHTLGTAVR